MFSGLIERTGQIQSLNNSVIEVRLSEPFAEPHPVVGDSVAVNGVCLTVTRIHTHSFTADVSEATLQTTALGKRRPGSTVNLERAVRPLDRLNGHIVTGHVDGVGRFLSLSEDGNTWFSLPEGEEGRKLLRHMVVRGSIAVDGISLTINRIENGKFRVTLIPHSIARTNLTDALPGSPVNLETDILAKHVEQLLRTEKRGPAKDGVSMKLLAENGFL